MLGNVTLPSTASFAGTYPAPAEIIARQRAAVEPVVRLEPVGARLPGRRVVPFKPERVGDVVGEVRSSPAMVGHDHDGTTGREPRTGRTLARSSTAFIAQYIGQALVPEGGLEERETAEAALAYRAAAERNIAYFGLEAPVDVSV